MICIPMVFTKSISVGLALTDTDVLEYPGEVLISSSQFISVVSSAPQLTDITPGTLAMDSLRD